MAMQIRPRNRSSRAGRMIFVEVSLREQSIGRERECCLYWIPSYRTARTELYDLLTEPARISPAPIQGMLPMHSFVSISLVATYLVALL